jgi:hypothetical protein
MTGDVSSDNDNPSGGGVDIAEQYLSHIAWVPTSKEIARFRIAMAMFAVIFFGLALTASFSPAINQPWPITICISMGVFYMMMTALAREIKRQQIS